MKKTNLKLGDFYSIEYNDHFHADRVLSEDPRMFKPVILETTGRLIAITPLQYNLEHNCQKSDQPGEYTHSLHGIMRSCITKITHLKPTKE
jgi:hypothetical protein